MTKEIIIITLIVLVIYLYYQQNNHEQPVPEHLSLIKDLKRQVQHYQGLYQKRVEKDLEKKDGETQTDLSDKQVSNLITQWNEVAKWATEIGIDVNQRWNLGLLKGKLTQQQQQFEQEKQNWQEEKSNLVKSKREELTAKMAELRASKERMEQMYKEKLEAKDKEKEEIQKKQTQEKEKIIADHKKDKEKLLADFEKEKQEIRDRVMNETEKKLMTYLQMDSYELSEKEESIMGTDWKQLRDEYRKMLSKLLDLIDIRRREDELEESKEELETQLEQLTQELQEKNNWGDDNLPQLKQELFNSFKITFYELKGLMEKATIAWGRKEIEGKMKDLDRQIAERERERERERE